MGMLAYMEVLGAEHVPQGGGAKESGGLRGIGHVYHGGQGVVDLVVDHSVHGDGDTVLGENLLGRDIKGDSSQVNLDDVVNTGDDGEQAGAHRTSLFNLAEPEDHSSLIFLEIE